MRELQANGYKSLEERTLEEAKKQTEKSHRALVVTLLTLLATVLIPFCSRCSREEDSVKDVVVPNVSVDLMGVESRLDSIKAKEDTIIRILNKLQRKCPPRHKGGAPKATSNRVQGKCNCCTCKKEEINQTN